MKNKRVRPRPPPPPGQWSKNEDMAIHDYPPPPPPTPKLFFSPKTQDPPSGPVVLVLGVVQKGGLGDGPLVGREEEGVGTGGVHLVRLAGVDGLLLDVLDVQGVQLLVEHLRGGGEGHVELWLVRRSLERP